jgi:hypothetical protein
VTSPRSGLQGRSWLGKLVPTLSARELLLLWLAVFCTFAAIGFLIDIVIGGRFPTAWLALTVLVSGVLAASTSSSGGRSRAARSVATSWMSSMRMAGGWRMCSRY